jgi:putative ABC transport system substrate-binding protein
LNRRCTIALLAAAAVAWPLAPAAQQGGKLPRVGFLWDSPAVFPAAIEAFRRGLAELGWIEGRNLIVEYRWTEGRYERLPELAQDLVRLKVDVIVAPSSIYTGAARRATLTIPIVFASHADPIGSGHVVSLARPGGNATGLTIVMTETNAKGLELLKEAVPRLTRVAVIWDPATPSHRPGLAGVESRGLTLKVEVVSVPVRTVAEFEGAFAQIVRARADAVLVLSTPLFIAGAKPLADLALRHKLPSLFGPRDHADAGGLLSYGPDRADLYRRAAMFVDKILKGANPAELPVEQATKFELIVNLRTAKAIGLTLPQSLLTRAEEIIE